MQWLRKMGTNQTFQRTAALAERDDMIAISDEDRELIEKQRVSEVKKHFQHIKEMQDNPQPVLSEKEEADINTMEEVELKAKAAELKIAIKDGMDVDKLRKLVKKTMADDAVDPTSQKPKGKRMQAPAVLKAPTTPEEAAASPANVPKQKE